MWFFMITCYVLSFLTFMTLLVAFVQSFFNFPVFQSNHVTFIIFTSILYTFTETLVIFFFVGTGVSIKEYTKKHQLDTRYHAQSIAIKRKVYPPLLWNLLIFMIVFILVGAVDTNRIPAWPYQVLFFYGLFHYIKVKIIQNECFKENTKVVLEMSGVKHALVKS